MQYFPGTEEAWFTTLKERIKDLINQISKEDFKPPDRIKTVPKSKIIYVLEFILEILRVERRAVIEDILYSPKTRGEGRIRDRGELEQILYYIETTIQSPREDFRLFEDIPSPIYGDLKVEYFSNLSTNDKVIRLNEKKSLSFIDPLMYRVNFMECNADKVLATSFDFEDLIRKGVAEKLNAVLVGLGNPPARSTRNLLRRLYLELNLPVYILTEATPDGLMQSISLIKGALEPLPPFLQKFSVTHALWIGVSIGDLQENTRTSILEDQDMRKLDLIKGLPISKLPPYKQELELFQEKKFKATIEDLGSLDIVKYVSDKIP